MMLRALIAAMLFAATPALAQVPNFSGMGIPNASSTGGGGAGNPCTTTASSVQYDAAGSFGCVSGATSDGTNLTLANTNFRLLGSSTGYTTLESALSSTSNQTLTLPATATSDTIVGRASTDTLTNKTITSSTDSLGGVTAAFGSDAKGDIYQNGGSSNVVTRLGIGSTGDCLVVASGLAAWSASTCALTASPTFTGTVTMPDSSTITSSGYGSMSFVGVNQAVPSTYVLGVTGTSQTGSSANGAVSISQTLNTSGTVTVFQMAVSNTGCGGTCYLMNLLGGGTGTTSEFNVTTSGNVTVGGSLTANSALLANATNSSSAFTGLNIRNASANASASEQITIGNNTSATEVTLLLNSSANTGGNGGNSFTISAAAGIWLSYGASIGLEVTSGGGITMPNLASSDAGNYLCESSGVVGQNGTACVGSRLDWKNNVAAFDRAGQAALRGVASAWHIDDSHVAAIPADINPLALTAQLIPTQFNGDGTHITDTALQFGLIAQNACDADERLCSRNQKTGEPFTFRPNAAIALLVADVNAIVESCREAANDNFCVELLKRVGSR